MKILIGANERLCQLIRNFVKICVISHFVFKLSNDFKYQLMTSFCLQTIWVLYGGPLRDLGLRVSRAFFNGLRAPKDEIAVLQGSIACSLGLQGLYFLKFEKIAMGIVLAPGLQAFKMMGSRAPATPLGGSLHGNKLYLIFEML